MFTGVPALTISPAAGIWLTIRPFGSTGCGDAWPSVRSLVRSSASASLAFFFVMSGTLCLPVPTATRTATSVPFSTFSPAFGVCCRIVPAGALSSACSFLFGSSLRSASVSVFSASNVDFSPTTLGTSTVCGWLRRNRKSSSRSSASNGISHQGSHGFWRKTPCVGISGAVGVPEPPRPGSLS